MKNCLSFALYIFVFPIVALCALASAAEAQDATAGAQVPAGHVALEIAIGEARLLPVAGQPKTIIVGDDTTIVANIIQDNILVFTGVAHGKTNVIILDSAGEMIEQVWVSVTKSGAPLTVRRGMATEEFRCNPACRPEDRLPVAPASGDSATDPDSQSAL